jgi:uncharacterized protein YndB with AHSA1/START domain
VNGAAGTIDVVRTPTSGAGTRRRRHYIVDHDEGGLAPAAARAPSVERSRGPAECRWSRVLAYEPPDRVVFSWDISPQWRLETDLAKTSEGEVRFIVEAPKRTRVELEHRNLERHGDGWENVRGGVAADGGWPLYLQRYVEQLAENV